MPLSSTNVKADAEKIQLAKLKGINLSLLFRNALDSSLRVSGDDKDMLESQLTDIRQQVEILNLEEKLILDQLKALDSKDAVEQYRETKFNQWKKNIAYQIENKTIDWNVIKKLFRFSTMGDCKTWITMRLKAEKLI
jgi:hypothetical protein